MPPECASKPDAPRRRRIAVIRWARRIALRACAIRAASPRAREKRPRRQRRRVVLSELPYARPGRLDAAVAPGCAGRRHLWPSQSRGSLAFHRAHSPTDSPRADPSIDIDFISGFAIPRERGSARLGVSSAAAFSSRPPLDGVVSREPLAIVIASLATRRPEPARVDHVFCYRQRCRGQKHERVFIQSSPPILARTRSARSTWAPNRNVSHDHDGPGVSENGPSVE
jgi:hypothetical protein